MTAFDPYTWLKALHVAAAITFVAGVLSVALFLEAPPLGHADMAQALHRWDRKVTNPAMLLVWALGLTLALMGGSFHGGWLPAKLVFVVALSGLHGVQSAKLRRLAGGMPVAVLPRMIAPFVVGSVLAIAILVVVKPL